MRREKRSSSFQWFSTKKRINGEANGCTLNGSVLTSGDTTGTVTVNVTVAADGNYEALAATPITVTISDKGTQTITASDVTATYGDTDKKVNASVTNPATGGGAVSYAVKDGSANYIEVNATTGALTIKKVPSDGKAYVVVTAAGTATYEQATKDVTVTINKANAIAATVTANSRTYDGTEKPLVTVTGEATGGEMQYALGENATTAPADNLYTTSIPAKTDAGTYYVWYKVKGDSSHNGTVPQPLTVTIRNPAPSGGGTTPATITIPVSGEGKDAETVNVTVQVTGTTATVTSADVDKVLEAKDVGNVTVNVESLNKTVDEVVLPAALVEKVAKAVADNGNDASGLEIKLPTGTVTFDATTVATLAQQSNGKDLKVHLDNVSQATLTSAQQNAVKDVNALVVLEAYVTADGKRISNFNGGKATFSVPVELKDGQVPEGVAAFFVDDNGDMTEIPCSCDGKTATGTVEHFSNYVITYDESRVTKPEPQPEPEPEPTPGPATPTDIGYDDLSDDQKKDADAVASALGVDKDTAAQMVKLADELGVSIDTVKLSGAALAKMNVDSSDPAGTDFGKLTARVTKRTNSALTLKWTKQKNADGYLIYGNKCGKGNKMKLLKTIKKNGTVSYTQKKLKKGTYYKYMVVAYKNVNGQKMPIAASVVLHAPTKGGKLTVAKSVKVNKAKVSVKKGKSVTIKATENKEEKKLKVKTHRAVKFESSNKKIAKVNAKGKITGKKKGTATVWAYAQNGIFKAIKVTVK